MKPIRHAELWPTIAVLLLLASPAVEARKPPPPPPTNTVTSNEPNITIIRGIGAFDGTILRGTGFSVAFSPAGDGGAVIDQVFVTGGSAVVHGDSSRVAIGAWIKIFNSDTPDSQFYQVISKTSSFTYNLHRLYSGTSSGITVSAQVITGMTLFPTYTVTFTTPFGEEPLVYLPSSSQSIQGSGGQGLSAILTLRDTSAPHSQSTFRVLISTELLIPNIPGLSTNWDFIAIGRSH